MWQTPSWGGDFGFDFQTLAASKVLLLSAGVQACCICDHLHPCSRSDCRGLRAAAARAVMAATNCGLPLVSASDACTQFCCLSGYIMQCVPGDNMLHAACVMPYG